MNPHTLLNRLRGRSLFIDGIRVVADKDVASAYGVALGRLRQAVTIHRERFPEDFLFRLANGGYAFTDEGILMLSSILKTPQAAQASVAIIRELFGFQAN